MHFPRFRSIAHRFSVVAALICSVAVPVQANQGRPDRRSWDGVRVLSPGTEIALTQRTTPASEVVFVSATDDGIRVLDLRSPNLPKAARRKLLRFVKAEPAAIDSAFARTRRVEFEDVALAPQGIYYRRSKVGDLADVLLDVRRSDVRRIEIPLTMKGSVGGAVAGVVVGAVVGILVGLQFETCQCPALAGAVAVTIPVGGGLLGYYGAAHSAGGVIFEGDLNAQAEDRMSAAASRR